MNSIFEIIVSIISVIAGLTSGIITLFNYVISKKNEKTKLQKSEEKRFQQILSSDNIDVLGNYLDEIIGKFNIYEYSTNPKISHRVNTYIDRIQHYVGTIDEIKKEELPKRKPKIKDFTEKLPNEYQTILNELETGEHWNALARLRRHIEIFLKKIAISKGLLKEEFTSAGRLLSLLERNEIISKNSAKKLGYSISICNRAIHGLDVSLEEAQEAIYLAVNVLDTLRRELKSEQSNVTQ